MSPVVILYIGDESDLVKAWLDEAPGLPYKFEVVDKNVPLIEQAKTIEPNLIICDLNARWTGGVQLLIDIRSDATLHETPMFVDIGPHLDKLDSHGQVEGTNVGGADKYVKKPYSSFDRDLVFRILA